MTIDWYKIFMYGYYYPTLIVAIIYLIDLYRTIKKGRKSITQSGLTGLLFCLSPYLIL